MAIVHVPGLVRVDVAPREDTLRIVVRNLSRGPCEWATASAPWVLADAAALELRPSAYALTIEVAGRRCAVLVGVTVQTAAGTIGLTAQARITGPGGPS